MSAPSSRRDDLANLLFGMEEAVRDLVRWGQAVRAMGCSGCDIEAGAIYVVGNAMVEAAVNVESDWERCLEVFHQLREVSR